MQRLLEEIVRNYEGIPLIWQNLEGEVIWQDQQTEKEDEEYMCQARQN